MSSMNSRERMLAAFRCEEVDRVPVPQSFWRGVPREQAFAWRDEADEIQWLRKHGFDPYLSLPRPRAIDHTDRTAPHVSETHTMSGEPGLDYRVLHSEWRSGRDVLTAGLRVTEDYPFEKMEMFSDFNTSRYIKPLLESGEDMLTLISMDPFRLPEGQELADWREQCAVVRKTADAEGLAVGAYGGCSLDYLIWATTADQAVMLALDYPEETGALLEYFNQRTEQMLIWSIEQGADFVSRRGWYDSADFWGPSQFREFAVPHIKRCVSLAHQADLPCTYLMCTGIGPMLQELAGIDFDCLEGMEPVCTGQDVRHIVQTLRSRKSFWTGVSGPIHLGLNTTDQVRQAVRDAFALFGTRGFLLSAVPSIRAHWPWENVMAMMDEYRRVA